MERKHLIVISRKILFSVLTLIYAAVAFTQATFAWITLNNETFLRDAELSIMNDSGLYLSLNGSDYKTNLTNEDIKNALESNILGDVTTTDGINFFDKENKLLEPLDNYISFTLWVKTYDPTVKELFLVENVTEKINYQTALENEIDGTFVVSKGINWMSDIDFTYGKENIKKGSINFFEAANAIRIAVVEENLDEEFEVSKKEDLIRFIYDPSENKEMGFGVPTGAYEYGKIKNNDDSLPTVFPNTKYSLSTFKNPYLANNDNSVCAKFQETKDEFGVPCYYTKVTVNIWLEGWDADCFDAILGDKLLIQLKFRGSSLTEL